ncbi:PREDICTED: A-kinase anchor protein 8-like [Nanorana parkeri]|uniref:A-kinase anchor protein 8-like n=1 Tax=Nanorana parkeri TaxID=125878 RepID=UPI0008546C0E|nr:PREDICTED: A-kinase anchor protein 8-like [Nanorana parkeri]
MAGRGRGGSGGDGYDSYDYTYDYGHDSAGSFNFVSESWMTSCPMPSNDGAKHLGPGRDSYGPYNRMDRGGYGFSEPERGYGNWRAQQTAHSSQLGWRGNARGGLGGNYRPPPAIRGPGHPMPLLNQGTFKDLAGFQGLRAFTGNSYFGGGFKQKSRRLWKDKKKLEAEGGGGPAEKKIKGSTEDSGAKCEESESEGDGEHAEGAETSTMTEAEDKQEEAEETDKDDKVIHHSTEQKQTPAKKQQEVQSRRQRDRMVERIQFVCSLCKFRTFYSEEMTSHLQSEFHKEHYRFVGGKLPKQSADFLQEYISHKTKKTEVRRNVIEDLGTTIQQIYRDQDLTQEFGMEHFVKKVEAAHCAACDMFIPMNFSALQRHIRTPPHNQNRRNMMENSKKTALTVARSILNNKLISQKLERYIKGQNPFLEEQDEAPGSSSAGLEASEGQAVTATADSSCENQDLPACSSSTIAAPPETMSSEDASEIKMTGDSEMCAPGGQEELTDTGVMEDPLHEHETSEATEMKY